MNRSELARHKVREASAELLTTEGVGGFTIDEISRRSGVAKTTIYRHWPSIQDLLVDTVACQIAVLPTPNTGSFRLDLLAYYQQVAPTIDIAQRARMFFGLLLAGEDDPELRAATEALMGEKRQPLRTIVELAMARGEVDRAIPLDLAIDMIEGPLAHRFLLRRRPDDAAELERLLDLIVAALRPASGTLTA